MDQHLTFRMLGPFEVLADGAPVAMPPSRKTRALLAYLVMAGRAQRRERLCEMFWDVPDDPKGALRWSLSKIRRIVGEAHAGRLKSDRAAVDFDTEALDIDAARVIGLREADLAALDTGALEAMADSYRGGFCEDLQLDRCPDFEAWRVALAFEAETTEVRLLRLLLDRLADAPARALPRAERLAALDPEDESRLALVRELRRAVRETVSGEIAAPARAAAPERPAAAQATGADLRYATARDGTRIAWTASGAGPVLVRAPHWLTHLGHDHESPVWGPWLQELTRGARLIRYDARGNGMSDRDVEDLSFDALNGDLEAVVEAAGLDRFTLFGASQGSVTALDYALRFPERVRGVVIYGGFAQGWRARGNPEEIARREAMLVLMQDGWGAESAMFRDLYTSMFMPDAPREVLAAFGEMQRETMTARDAMRLQSALADVDLLPRLGQIRVPVLVMHATGDQMSPLATGRALAEAIPGARFVELDSNNHLLMPGEPAFARCNEEIRAFLRETPELTVAPAAPVAAQSQRRRATVLDIEMISPLLVLDGFGAEDAAEEQSALIGRMRGIAEAQGGVPVDAGQGRAVFAFGVKTPSEIHAVQACRAALQIREMIDSATDGAVRVRQGIDTGTVVIRDLPGKLDVSGVVIRRARQINGALRGAVIALSDEATAETGAYCSFSAIRSVDLAGVRGRRVFELKAIRTAPSRWRLRDERKLSAFVGRAEESAVLERALSEARAGKGRAVLVSGEPGVGKSRLTHEFLETCGETGIATVELGALELDDNAPMSLLARLFDVLLKIGHGPDPDLRAAATRAALAELQVQDLTAPVLFALDLPADDPAFAEASSGQKRHRVRDALRRIIALKAAQAPLVILVEDLHWADDVSMEALERLIEGVERLPVLLVMTARPGFAPVWLVRGGVRHLPLDTLSGSAAGALVRTLLGPHPSLSVLRRQLASRTEGLPLMIEETISALAQSGRIGGVPGAYVASAPILDVEPRASVMPVIAARIAALGPGPRRLVQIAAAIGREGPLVVLRRVSGLAADVFADTLQGLEQGEFLYELIGGSGAYTFKHALIREAAYDSLIPEERTALHREIYEAFRAVDTAQNIEPLAHHAYHGGLWAEAVDWLLRAAARAVERSAYDRAVTCLERADGALSGLPPDERTLLTAIDIRLAMQPAYASLGSFEAATARIAEACDLAEKAGDAGRLAQGLLKRAYLAGTIGQLDAGLEAAERLVAHATRHGLEVYACEADLAAAFALTMKGAARPALAHLMKHRDRFTGERRLERYQMVNTRSVWLNGSIAHAAAMLGEMGLARAAIAEARAVAAETGRPQDNLCSLQFSLQVTLAEGVTDHALAEVQVALAESLDEHLFPAGPWLLTTLGDAMLQIGRREAAEAVLERAYEAADSGHMRGIALMAARLLAVAQVLGGNGEAREELAELVETDMPVWLRTRIRMALAQTEASREVAIGHLQAAAEDCRAGGLRPDLARCLEALARRTEGAVAQKARAEAQALWDAMDTGGPVAAHA